MPALSSRGQIETGISNTAQSNLRVQRHLQSNRHLHCRLQRRCRREEEPPSAREQSPCRRHRR